MRLISLYWNHTDKVNSFHQYLNPQGPYVNELKKVEKDMLSTQKLINEKMGIKESDTGLSYVFSIIILFSIYARITLNL